MGCLHREGILHMDTHGNNFLIASVDPNALLGVYPNHLPPPTRSTVWVIDFGSSYRYADMGQLTETAHEFEDAMLNFTLLFVGSDVGDIEEAAYQVYERIVS